MKLFKKEFQYFVLNIFFFTKISDAIKQVSTKTGFVPSRRDNSLGNISRIFASAGEFPWEVAIHTHNGDHCSGSLIKFQVVLTVAHCVQGIAPFQLNFGDINRNGLHVTARHGIMHEFFDQELLDNDIGFIFIPKAKINLLENDTLPVEISKNEIEVGTQLKVAGWGKSRFGEDARRLKVTVFERIENRNCGLIYRKYMNKNLVCIKHLSGFPCIADSGAGVILNKNGTPKLVGIVTFGSKGPCNISIPITYTKIGPYLDWIRENSKY